MRGALPFLAAVLFVVCSGEKRYGLPVPSSESTAAPVAPSQRPGCGWVVLGTVVVLALLVGFIFVQLENLPFRIFGAGTGKLEDWAGKVRGAFVAIAGMQPRVTVNEHVVYEQSNSMLELAVVEREMSVERETEDTWMGSTKKLRVRGTFRVKAGFDLTQPFAVQITDGSPPVVSVRMPPPRLLSVEQENIEVLTMDNGLWNHMQPGEYAQAVNDLNTDARLKALRDGLVTEAKKRFTEQLEQKLGPGERLEITTAPVNGTDAAKR